MTQTELQKLGRDGDRRGRMEGIVGAINARIRSVDDARGKSVYMLKAVDNRDRVTNALGWMKRWIDRWLEAMDRRKDGKTGSTDILRQLDSQTHCQACRQSRKKKEDRSS